MAVLNQEQVAAVQGLMSRLGHAIKADAIVTLILHDNDLTVLVGGAENDLAAAVKEVVVAALDEYRKK